VVDAELPAPQVAHAVIPLALWYIPAAHGVHEAELEAEKVPAKHEVQEPAPDAVLYEPARQFRHEVAPVLLW